MSDVIPGSPGLRRCKLSHNVLSAFCLICVSFLQVLYLGGFGMLWSLLGAARTLQPRGWSTLLRTAPWLLNTLSESGSALKFIDNQDDP